MVAEAYPERPSSSASRAGRLRAIRAVKLRAPEHVHIRRPHLHPGFRGIAAGSHRSIRPRSASRSHRLPSRQRGQTAAGYVAVVALGLMAIWGAWNLFSRAVTLHYDSFAFAIGLPVI